VHAISSATDRIIVALGVCVLCKEMWLQERLCNVAREVFGTCTFLARWWWLWQVEMK
jgi:hypothetical protein